MSQAIHLKKHVPRWLVHLGLGIAFAGSLLVLPRFYVVVAGTALVVCFASFEIARFRVSRLQRWIALRLSLFLRPQEEKRFTGATFFLIGVTITAAVFPGHIAALAILFLAVGDPAAAAFGMWKGRRQLWGRTIEGNLACLVTCAALAGIVASLVREPGLITAETGAVVATLLQALPWRINDNLVIPIGSAAAMLAIQAALRAVGAQ